MSCPDCVNESNWRAWQQYLSKQISKLLSAETMQTVEFQKEMEAVRRDEEERLERQKRLDEVAETRRRRSCMERPKIDYIPKGLHIDLEAAYAKYFQQVVTFIPKAKDVVGAMGEEVRSGSVGQRQTRCSLCDSDGAV